MKKFTKFSVIFLAVSVMTFMGSNSKIYAQNGNQSGAVGFADENGDGYNDYAPDHDGDGIPDGLDPDYQALNPEKSKRFGFIDEDGDGINDRLQDADEDGIPNGEDPDWVKPEDGSGAKPGQNADKNFNNGKKFNQNLPGAGEWVESGPLGAGHRGTSWK